MEIIQELHKWAANIMIIIFLYSSMMWFWFSADRQKIGNSSFRFFISLEMGISGILLLLGISLIITNPNWLGVKGVYIKIFLGLFTIGSIHLCATKTKKFLDSSMNRKDIKIINIIRALTIILLMTVYTTGTMIRVVHDGDNIKEFNEKIGLYNEN